jgi:oligopeptide transport system ATP-binding protein
MSTNQKWGQTVSSNNELISVRDLKKYFPIRKGILFDRKVGDVKAVDGVSFDIIRGETLGLVGESGCGKSTTGYAILFLDKPSQGDILFDGVSLSRLSERELRKMRPRMQIIFQDPYASLNPRMTVGELVGDPILIHTKKSKAERRERVLELLDLVGLNRAFERRYPHEFSGGQRQRIGIARALALNPDFIVCDEPISALDVSVQAQVVNLLEDLQEQFGLTYLFIAHDLSMVRHIANRVMVMYLGKMMELAARDELYDDPLHPYTQALVSAVPVPDPEIEMERKRIILTGDVPSPSDPPPGCVFHTRCNMAEERCRVEVPHFREVKAHRFVACHLVEKVND